MISAENLSYPSTEYDKERTKLIVYIQKKYICNMQNEFESMQNVLGIYCTFNSFLTLSGKT